MHFRSLRPISRHQWGSPEPLRSRGDWLKGLCDAFGKLKAFQRFLQFQGSLCLMGMFASKLLFLYILSLLKSLWSQEHSLKPSVILPLLPPPAIMKTPKHSRKALMSTAGFTEMWVENRRACHCKHRHPHLLIESWSPVALGCTLIITAQEDVIWPSIPFVTYPKPVFWLLSLISLLSSLLSFPSAQPRMNEANSSPCFLWCS